jgi:hypothetical protein
MAVLRADLHDPDDDVPAAWAMLEVLLDGVVLGRGIADERGCVVVVFPVPEPIDAAPDSPMAFGMPLTKQVWNLSMRAYYKPANPVPSVPDLCSLLSQPEADLWREWNSSAVADPFTGVDLLYGREATAVSFNSANEPLSRLYVTPV